MQSEPQTERHDTRTFLVGGSLILLLIFAAYARSLSSNFIWDDPLLVQQNPLVTGEFTLRSIWFRTDFPLSNVALWLEWLCFGKSALGYRIVNLLLHAASCVLLWRLLRKLGIPGAWLAAALFAVHPVGVGSVAWISEIKNTLSLPCYLLGFWWFVRAVELGDAAERAKARRVYLLSLVAFVLALLSKTSTVVLPAIILMWTWWKQKHLTTRDCSRLLPHFGLAIAFGIATIWFQKHQTLAGFTLPVENFPTKLAVAGIAVWFYLGKALWPFNLNAIYPRWEIDSHNALVYLPLIALLALAILFWWSRRSWGRHALFALGCFVASLFPVLGFFGMYFLAFSRVSDHFQYLALMVPLTAVAALLCAKLPSKLFYVARAIVIVGLCALSMQHAKIYATDEALWRDTLAKNPAAWNAHNNLGCILAENNDIPGATEQFVASLKLNPRNPSAHCNLGKVMLLKNNFAEAESHFQTALEIKPDHVDTLKSYGEALATQGQNRKAIKLLSEAVRLKPDDNTRSILAAAFSATGQDGNAVIQLRQILQSQPDDVGTLNNLAWILATSSDQKVRAGVEAVKLASRACELTHGKEAQMLGTLAAAYAASGDFANAVATAEKTIVLARAGGNEGFAAVNEQLLRLYRSGRPYHSPAVKP